MAPKLPVSEPIAAATAAFWLEIAAWSDALTRCSGFVTVIGTFTGVIKLGIAKFAILFPPNNYMQCVSIAKVRQFIALLHAPI
jgi:hypothetical protein